MSRPPPLTRRAALQLGGASILAALLPGCGRSTPCCVPPPDPSPVVPPSGRYRNAQRRLFQAIPGPSAPARIAGGDPFSWRSFGPTGEYVDRRSGWAWDHPGGDWLDADGVRQGPRPWFSFEANGASGSAAAFAYTVDVTAILQAVAAQDRWNVLLLRVSGGARAFAGTAQSAHPTPAVDVVYADGTSGRLACLCAVGLDRSTSGTTSGDATLHAPLALELERPAGAVRSATLSLTVTEHWSGASTVSGFLVDPPLNAEPVALGLAAAHGPLDDGLATDPAVIGVHRYVDGTTLADFSHPEPINFGAEREYDPAIFGTGPSDATRLPHRGLGRWIHPGEPTGWSVVGSGHAQDGFAPLAPGLGALRVVMPATPGLADGAVVGYAGTTAANSKLFLPEPDFGRLKRLFVRYYLRLGTPYATPFARRLQVRNAASAAPAWTDCGGKTGICPAHDTTYGGVSGSSGGGYGWQMRLSWADCDAEVGGPSENAITLGLHTYDFLDQNPVPMGATDGPRDTGFGQRGGLGGVLYPGVWYCLELEVDLNSVSPAPPGYAEDGAVRFWIDGRLAYERTGMVMRSLPLHQPSTADPTRLRPARELGHRDLWFDWFHGGKTQNTVDRVVFITGLAWGRSYIGPMRGA